MPSPTGVRKKDPPARKPPGPDLSKTFVLCGVSGIGERANERLIDSRGEIDWASLKGANIRIIEDDEHRLTLLLRHACASDCRIDVLDTHNIDYAIVTYDDSAHRSLKKKLGIPVLLPMLHRMPPFYALSLLKEYQRASSEPRRPRPLGAAASGRNQDPPPEGDHRQNRRSIPKGADR